MIIKIKSIINSKAIFYKDMLKQNYYRLCFNDHSLIRKRFKKKLNRDLDLVNPIKYNDKIQWLKLYWYDPKATICADKYAVREFVKNRIGEEYLNDLYSYYDGISSIDISELPRSFVLKGNHGSGLNIICEDKEKIDWNEAFSRMKSWFNYNYYWKSREWVYKDIKPRIICEKYLEDKDNNDLRDYKFFCFNGEVKIVQVDFDRFRNHRRNYYDLTWKLLNVEICQPSDHGVEIDKPHNFNKMVEIAETLSKGFPHVRIDLYNIGGKIIFGEMTFFHGSGLEKISPTEYETVLGEWIQLPLNNGGENM